MSTNEYASQLTNLGLPPPVDASALAAEAIKKSRRRIRSLASMMIGLWLLAALLIPSVLLPMWAKLKHHGQEYSWAGGERKPTDQLSGFEAFESLAVVSTFIATVSTMASLLGAIATVWLVLTVRRTTLEQISTGLAQISEQLRQLQQRPAG